MEVEFLDDGELPLGTLSLRQCSAMLALENADIEPHEDPKAIEALWDVPPHALGLRDFPRGKLSRARDEIESALCRDIDADRLVARQVRRTIGGALSVTETLLDFDALAGWARTYGFELGDTLDAYMEGEGDAAVAALEAIKATRERLVDAKSVAEARKRASLMSEDEVVALFMENQRLKSEKGIETERPLNPRERNNFLRIIRALDVMAKLPQRGCSTSILTQLQEMGFDGPREDKVRAVIDEARKLDP